MSRQRIDKSLVNRKWSRCSQHFSDREVLHRDTTQARLCSQQAKSIASKSLYMCLKCSYHIICNITKNSNFMLLCEYEYSNGKYDTSSNAWRAMAIEFDGEQQCRGSIQWWQHIPSDHQKSMEDKDVNPCGRWIERCWFNWGAGRVWWRDICIEHSIDQEKEPITTKYHTKHVAKQTAIKLYLYIL